jgi:arylsulfatase A-like enzyme
MAAGFSACGSSDPPKFNLVLIVADALRPDHTGAYGYDRPTTPNMDRLAKESVLFRTALASAAFTLPSMATLFTSLQPMEHGVRSHLDPSGTGDFLGPEFHTLAERLKDRGYGTGAVVSNSLFLLKKGFDQGFDHFDAGRRRDAGPTTDAALSWLQRQSDTAPFFLWVHYIDPHWPYDAPRDFARPFVHNDRGQFQRMVRAFDESRLKSDQIYFENSLDEDGVLRGIAEYDNEVAYMDQHLGRLVDYLKSSGLYENTVIAVVSDHGEALGEHDLYFAHSFYLYDEIQRVVMMLKAAGKAGPRSVDEPVRLLDLMPTLYSLLDLAPENGMAGRDLAPLCRGRGMTAGPPDPPAYAESEPRYVNRKGAFRYPYRKRIHGTGIQSKWRMIRTRDHKLIFIPGEGMELYDLQADPGEEKNIFDERPDLAGLLGPILEQWVADDPGVKPGKAGAPGQGDAEAVRLIREMGY